MTIRIIALGALLAGTASAAVPLRWTVETSRVQPATFEAYQGETLALEAALQSYGKPLAAPDNYAIYWQTNGMGTAWWSMSCASASSPTNVLHAVWSPDMDVGARAYNCFIGQTGTIFHAAFQLRLRPSPGAVPNELPLPTPVIDFARVTVLNPPWTGGVDTNAVRDIVAPLLSSISNRVEDVDAAKRDRTDGDFEGTDIRFGGDGEGIRWGDYFEIVGYEGANEGLIDMGGRIRIMSNMLGDNYAWFGTEDYPCEVNVRGSMAVNGTDVMGAIGEARAAADGAAAAAERAEGVAERAADVADAVAAATNGLRTLTDRRVWRDEPYSAWQAVPSKYHLFDIEVLWSDEGLPPYDKPGWYIHDSEGATSPVWTGSADPHATSVSCDHYGDIGPVYATRTGGLMPDGDKEFVDSSQISAADPAFSNAVLAVGLNIDTNSVAVLNEIAETFGEFPITGTATTVGGLLAALAAAVAWLRKRAAHLDGEGFADDPFAADLLSKQVAKEAVRYAFNSPTSSTTTSGTVETTAITANSNTVASVTIPAAASGNTPSLAITVPNALGSSDVRDLIIYAVNADTANDCPIGIVGGTPVPQDGAEAKIPKGSRAYICVSKMPTAGEWFIQAVKLTAAA